MLSPELAAALARCTPHARALHLGVPTAEAAALPAESYHRVAFLRDEIDAFAQTLGTHDARAAASVWAKHYIAALLPGVCALATLEGVALDASAEVVRVEVQEHRAVAAWVEPARVLLHAERARELPPSVERAKDLAHLHAFLLQGLVERHLRPLFDALEEATGLWPGVAWNSAGNTLAWYYDRFAQLRPAWAHEDRRALLMDPSVPFHDPVEYEDLHAHGLARCVQVRRTCCLRHRLPDARPCYTCPRLSGPERVALLRELEGRA